MTTAARLYLYATGADSLVCSVCGYGVARTEPPEHCPMCQERDGWVPVQARPCRRFPKGGARRLA